MQVVPKAAKSFISMSKSLLTASLLLAICGASWCQTDSDRAERTSKARAVKKSADDPDQRRAAVRAALGQAREQNTTPSDDAAKTRRQLTAQERHVLREQLREQRNNVPGN